jgi:hypothetical protein
MDAAVPSIAALRAPELSFRVEESGPLEHAAVPTLRFALAIEAPCAIRSVGLAVELRIAATRRSYDPGEQERLSELFGRPEDWSRNLHALHWTTLTVNVPPFDRRTVVELAVPCSYDLEVAAAKYFNGLAGGEIPLELLFSGTVFYAGEGGALQVGRIGWDKELTHRLPVAAWRAAIDRHFPRSAWLRLDRARFDRLCAYKARHSLLSWDAVVDRLLPEDDA